MQMRFWMVGFGVKLGNTGFALNGITKGRIYFRSVENEDPYILTIADHLTIGSGNGTLGFTNVKTEYFVVNLSANRWLHKKNRLISRTGRLSISGSTFYSGTVDITFSILDNFGQAEHELKVMSKPASGLQIASTSVTGTILPYNFNQFPEELREEYIEDYEDNTWTLPTRH